MLSKSKNRTLLGGLLLLCVISFAPSKSNASLTPADHDSLWHYFTVLSATGWNQWCVDHANGILASSNYDMPDYLEFYQEYFSQNLMTYWLWDYLGYPTFWWFSSQVHYNLQEALRDPATNSPDTIFSQHQDSLALGYFASHPQQRAAVHNYLHDLWLLCNYVQSVIPDTSRDAISTKATAWINQYPQWFLHSVTLNPAQAAYMPAFRWQLEAVLVDRFPLEAARLNYLAGLFNLQGTYDTIFRNHKVLIEDNNYFDAPQLNFLGAYFANQPDTLSNLRFLSQVDQLYAGGQTQLYISTSAAVNVFATRIGQVSENSFPGDIDPVYTDQFCICVAHEANHIVDAYTLSTTANPDYAQIRQMLLQAAGTQDSMYLRTWPGSGNFFQSAPQEFIASIANEWFDDSQHTVELGISRFQRGWEQPINQALFFCEIYSLRGDSTLFYRIPPNGQITVYHVPVERDTLGRINAITFPTGEHYDFTLSPAGFVTAIYSPPPVVVTLTPQNPPIIIPYNGGSFDFTITVANQTAVPQSFDLWTEIVLPNVGSVQIITATDLSLPANFSTFRNRTQSVPAFAPAGVYTYYAYVGDYPWVVSSSDFFNFSKSGADYAGALGEEHDWPCSGDGFDDLLSTAKSHLPQQLALHDAFPNPFNPSTALSYQLSANSHVSLKIYNTAGRLVATLVDGWRDAGQHQITFDGSHLTSGVYICRLEAGDFVASQKIVLLK